MGDIIVQLSLLDPLYVLFGWLTRVLFQFFGNYGLAIIFLTVIIRGALIPLSIRSQKSMLKMQALSGKQAELQRIYGDDKEAYQEAFMKMQKENGAGGLSGCLLPFLQLFFIWPIYRIVSGPLIYLSQVSKESIASMIDLGNRFGESGILGGSGKVSVDIHIGLIKALNENAQFLNECIKQGFIKLDQMVDLHFLGMDLTVTPAWNPVTIIHDPKTYVPMLIIPVLVVATNILVMQMTKWLKPGWKEEEEAKKRAKLNKAMADPANKGGAEDYSQNMMKMMNWMMPALMLVTTFTMPAAMGLYWIISGLMSIVTNIIVYYMFTKPYEAKKAEIEAKKQAVFKKSGKAALAAANAGADADSSKKNGKKNKN